MAPTTSPSLLRVYLTHTHTHTTHTHTHTTHTHTHTDTHTHSILIVSHFTIQVPKDQGKLTGPALSDSEAVLYTKEPPLHLPAGSRFLTPCHAPPHARVTASAHSCCGSFGPGRPTRPPSFAWKTCNLSIQSQLSHHFFQEAFLDLPE